jgi:hypothetical protein
MKALSSIAADQLCFWYDCNGPDRDIDFFLFLFIKFMFAYIKY